MKKLKLLLLCIPMYPLSMFGEWYFTKTTLVGSKFNLKKETKLYWREVFEFIKK